MNAPQKALRGLLFCTSPKPCKKKKASGKLRVMQQIHISYQWAPLGLAEVRNRHSPLRNPLMDLLQAVLNAGSIAGAAKLMGLSYRHVWGELKRWEQTLGQPLILWEKGQAARLSGFADKLLWAERQAQARLAPQISALQAELEKTFAIAFDPTHQALPIYASHDDALVMLREVAAAQSLHLDLRFCGSVDAIRALNEGRCHVAGFHAPWQPDAHSLVARTYKPLLKPGQHKLIGFATRTQGLMVEAGNPLHFQSLADVARAGVRYVNRSPGTGTRLLLDQCLQVLGLQALDLTGYDHEENSHAAVAACIAAGQADAGLGIASAAQVHGLDFVPLYPERYWLVCLASALESEPVRQLRQLLKHEAWLARLQGMAGYTTTTDAGQVQSLRSMLPWWQFKAGRAEEQG
jgi:putative molybdopterin biosynthesis protein